MSNSATKMACAACLVVAATLPAAGSSAEHLRDENLRLSAFTDVDAFSAIPSYLMLLNGNTTALADLDLLNGIPPLFTFLTTGNLSALAPAADGSGGYAALSALPVFSDVLTAGNLNDAITALGGYDALSAVPSYVALAQATSVNDAIDALGGIDAFSALPVFRNIANATSLVGNSPTSVASILGGYAALSAADTFFGDGPTGQGGVFTGAGIDALAPDADGNGGYAALSALPVFFGGNNGPFGPGVFNGGGVGALSNYDALSAIPAYLTPPTTMAAPFAATNAGPQAKLVQDPPTTTPPTGSNPVKTFVASLPKLPDFTPPAPQVFTPPTPPTDEPTVEAAATPGDNNNGPQLNVQRTSEKFTPKGIGSDNPLLFGSGNSGVDNGIRGWGDALKKMGIGGGGDSGTN
jgi:hypothetical protein